MDTIYRGCRISADRATDHQINHYSGGDTLVAAALASGAQLIIRAYAPDRNGRTTIALHAPGTAFADEAQARRAVDRYLDEEEPC